MKCQFKNCLWTDHCVNKLLDHCMKRHLEFVIKIGQDNIFNFELDAIFVKTFLLIDNDGQLYWFLWNPMGTKTNIRRGIFIVGNAKKVQYFVKLSSTDGERRACLGPLRVRSPGSKLYDIKFSANEYRNVNAGSDKKIMQIFFGTSDDGDAAMEQLSKAMKSGFTGLGKENKRQFKPYGRIEGYNVKLKVKLDHFSEPLQHSLKSQYEYEHMQIEW